MCAEKRILPTSCQRTALNPRRARETPPGALFSLHPPPGFRPLEGKEGPHHTAPRESVDPAGIVFFGGGGTENRIWRNVGGVIEDWGFLWSYEDDWMLLGWKDFVEVFGMEI